MIMYIMCAFGCINERKQEKKLSRLQAFYLNKQKACTGNGNNFFWKT